MVPCYFLFQMICHFRISIVLFCQLKQNSFSRNILYFFLQCMNQSDLLNLNHIRSIQNPKLIEKVPNSAEIHKSQKLTNTIRTQLQACPTDNLIHLAQTSVYNFQIIVLMITHLKYLCIVQFCYLYVWESGGRCFWELQYSVKSQPQI